MKRTFLKTAGLLAAALALVSQTASAGAATQKDNVAGYVTTAAASTQKFFATGDKKPYKYYKKGNRNQRQYRKFLKSNPHFRNSKKCRL